FLTTSWPWRSLGYLTVTAVLGPVLLVALACLVLVGAATALLLVGVLVLGTLPTVIRAVGELERRRLGLLRYRPGGPTRPAPRRAREWLSVPWPEAGYVLLLTTALWVLDLVVLMVVVTLPVVLLLAPWLTAVDRIDMASWTIDPGLESWWASLAGLAALVGSAYVVTVVAAAQASLARLLLDPREAELSAAVTDLRRSRVDLVGAFETERRRIERDLHDGVQQRLVALTMNLGRAELDLPDGPGLEAVRTARGQAEAALEDLRGTIRGIHPRVLVDHGLEAAVLELADRSTVTVSVDLALDHRLPPSVEQAAYFVVSEALTNISRHSGARRARVAGSSSGTVFRLRVSDDGTGGARADGPGTGLAGLSLRLEALGGSLSVDSPAGGPTEVRMECPCHL
ncbi:MAG: sensor histidine kinase, partial [Phycicoccus sp.]